MYTWRLARRAQSRGARCGLRGEGDLPAGGSVSARLDLYSTRNRGSAVDADDDEDGWAITVAAKREVGKLFTAFVEYLHVESDRDARTRASLSARQAQNQVQMVMRARW